MAYLINQGSPMPASFRGATLNCKICGSAFRVPPSRASSAEFCSTKCAAVVRGLNRRKRVSLSCEQCGKAFEVPTCHKDRRKFCSHECKNTSAEYKASVAHKGAANPMWNGGEAAHSDGYIYERCPDHPFASNSYVLQHRLVMERWLRKYDPTSMFLITVGGGLYLSPNWLVHHDDEDRSNNDIGNLLCLTQSEHQRLHAYRRRRKLQQSRLCPGN